jgi:GDP-L-fucose synthase
MTYGKIIVTGGGGFLGKHVVKKLLESGYESNQLIVPRHITYDLTDRYDCEKLFYSNGNPETVIHLAASCGGIGANRENPGYYFYENMMMGLNVIEAARNFGVQKFVMVGTVCSYPKHCPVPFTEEDIWNGYPEETNAPYGIAKKALYTMLKAYEDQFGFNSTVLIPSNLYGPGDNFDPRSSHVIPALILKFKQAMDDNHRDVELWGTGKATREFLYVDDAAEAIVKSLSIHTSSDPINVGTGNEISIIRLAEMIANMMGFKGTIFFDTDQPDGQPRRCVDTTKAARILDFEARTSLEKGLKETIDWFLVHY